MRQGADTRRTATISILLALVALVGVAAVTTAWISIADNARIHNMNMEVTAGASLRFDLDAHEDFVDYVETLSSEQIYARSMETYGVSPETTPLVPVTTADAQTFTLRNGEVKPPESGAYLSFTLHFMSTEDMLVHLTSNHSAAREDGTLISSSLPQLPSAMRVSFASAEETSIFDPGEIKNYKLSEKVRVFSLPPAGDTVYNDENCLFFLKANTDTPIPVRVWMEGSDAACTDDVKNGDFSIRLRFIGTNLDHTPIR